MMWLLLLIGLTIVLTIILEWLVAWGYKIRNVVGSFILEAVVIFAHLY